MTTKLTLSINKRVIDKAKKYAKKQGKSLSLVVEGYLKAITQDEAVKDPEELTGISPEVQELVGMIKAPKDFDYKKVLEEALWEKYMK